MAHEIYIANGNASMAFIGETPWHGLGQALTLGASIETWKREAGFEWSAVAAPVKFDRTVIVNGQEIIVPASYDSQRVIYRSDTGAPLSVMSDGYKMVQPGEVLEFFRSITEDNGFHLETAGILKGGRKLWALAKNGHDGEIVKGDRVQQYLMLATSLDGSTPTIASFTATRVVCANTIAIALRDAAANKRASKGKARKDYVGVSHRSVFDADAVKAQLGLADASWNQFLADSQALAAKGVSQEQARDILRSVFGMPVGGKKDAQQAAPAAPVAMVAAAPAPAALAVATGDLAALLNAPHVPKHDAEAEGRDLMARLIGGNAREQKSVARCLALFNGEGRGSDHAGVKGTAWGLLNAVTEHIDHEQGRTRDSGLDSAWFGRGDAAKQSTLQALLAV